MEPLDTNKFGYSEQKLLFLIAVSTSRMWNISRLFLGTSWISDLIISAEAASVIKSRIPSLPKNNLYLHKLIGYLSGGGTSRLTNVVPLTTIVIMKNEKKRTIQSIEKKFH